MHADQLAKKNVIIMTRLLLGKHFVCFDYLFVFFDIDKVKIAYGVKG